MMSIDPYKRILTLGSLLMVVAILAPSFIKLGHALHGHNQEKQCLAQGVNHIHDVVLDCDFQDFTLVNKIFFNTAFHYTALNAPKIGHIPTVYAFIFEPVEGVMRTLRAPPC
ncbi:MULTISPECIES: hypothetical protein [Flagellimonas]|uniref:Uncharacterized protein n=1 Tax=Flagellimonas hadalis TaxID=2597517 RepID=A0A5N5IWZ1_9FLAO|nr:hypothetical protein [Allomuricauda hadalis]KAB5491653.1 hypothetical protein FOT42_001510 [Allomuricauda hadalis]